MQNNGKMNFTLKNLTNSSGSSPMRKHKGKSWGNTSGVVYTNKPRKFDGGENDDFERIKTGLYGNPEILYYADATTPATALSLSQIKENITKINTELDSLYKNKSSNDDFINRYTTELARYKDCGSGGAHGKYIYDGGECSTDNGDRR